MKSAHFKKLFSKDPLFKLFVRNKSRTLVLISSDECFADWEQAQKHLKDAGVFSNGCDQAHLLLSTSSLAKAQELVLKDFLLNMFSYTKYEKIFILSELKKSPLLNVIPEGYQNALKAPIIFTLCKN